MSVGHGVKPQPNGESWPIIPLVLAPARPFVDRPNGNFSSVLDPTGPATTMLWEYENRMKLHQYGTTVTNFAYCWNDGLLRSQSGGAGATTTIWDGKNYLQGRS